MMVFPAVTFETNALAKEVAVVAVTLLVFCTAANKLTGIAPLLGESETTCEVAETRGCVAAGFIAPVPFTPSVILIGCCPQSGKIKINDNKKPQRNILI
jgi:hypothetical protein